MVRALRLGQDRRALGRLVLLRRRELGMHFKARCAQLRALEAILVQVQVIGVLHNVGEVRVTGLWAHLLHEIGLESLVQSRLSFILARLSASGARLEG